MSEEYEYESDGKIYFICQVLKIDVRLLTETQRTLINQTFNNIYQKGVKKGFEKGINYLGVN